MAAVLDHIPIVMKMKMAPPVDLTPLRERWDRTKLRAATLTGENREPFLQDIQERLETHRPSYDILESREVTTGHTALLMTMVRDVGCSTSPRSLSATRGRRRWTRASGTC